MHLLAESAVWDTRSEFVDSHGKVSEAVGESKIVISEAEIINESWVELNGTKLSNTYQFQKITDFMYQFKAVNPALGTQIGSFHIDRNIIYSNFTIENTELTGFEVIVCHPNQCQAYGALYRSQNLINTWTALMEKR